MVEILSFLAGIMTSSAPLAQAFRTFRTRDIAGLSVSSYLLLLCMGSFTVLIGIQYMIFAMIILNAIGLVANLAIMFLLSRLAFSAFLLTVTGLAAASLLVAPWFIPQLLTPLWAEQVAFIYGLLAAATFLPQILLTRRTRIVSSLSLPYLLLLSGGMILWTINSIILGNYSLTFWNGILLLMSLELLRLKITCETEQRRTAPSA
ncbi:uncharacterized protein with PQ loop repeat [Sphingopyxis panaciterrae]|uniref:PQ-loop domain-containing transporter n=1 Tax=Sphingopyxis panaciterrae TaxID=363841 RepID=UPI0014246AA2|nr:PQ-loop domain-containing transporter [Sphingopyxis panaciterrae]NIJ37419.1 uncharacterized protein with PQ loop repeat [Sphingopyxis panaciterrae]